MRAPRVHAFVQLVPRLEDVFRGAAMMTGTEVEITPSALPYREIAPNAPLEEASLDAELLTKAKVAFREATGR